MISTTLNAHASSRATGQPMPPTGSSNETVRCAAWRACFAHGIRRAPAVSGAALAIGEDLGRRKQGLVGGFALGSVAGDEAADPSGWDTVGLGGSGLGAV